jgi:hypothetical protein
MRFKSAETIVPAVVIPLTRGYVAIIDADQAEWVTKLTWHARGKGHHIYAARFKPGGEHMDLHRALMDCPAGLCVDHINGNTLDNRKANLRICTHAQNMRNRHTESEAIGCYYDTKRCQWRTRVQRDGQTFNLGRFDTQEEAEAAYKETVAGLDAHEGDIKDFVPPYIGRKTPAGAYYDKTNRQWRAELSRNGVRYRLGIFR